MYVYMHKVYIDIHTCINPIHMNTDLYRYICIYILCRLVPPGMHSPIKALVHQMYVRMIDGINIRRWPSTFDFIRMRIYPLTVTLCNPRSFGLIYGKHVRAS